MHATTHDTAPTPSRGAPSRARWLACSLFAATITATGLAAQTASLATQAAAPAAEAERSLPPVAIQPLMGDPLDGLTPEQLDRFEKGRLVFEHVLTIPEGLGPGFNESSCSNCHNGPRIGGSSSSAVVRFGKAAAGSNPFDPLENLGGSLLQEQSIGASCLETVPPEANVVIERITPLTFGAGLVEAIPSAAIIDLANNPPYPAVAGIVHMVTPLEGGAARPGRFGWKNQVATVLSFSADASLNEMGLTNRLLTHDNAPNGDVVKLAACDGVADPEDGPDSEGFDRIDRQTDFQRFLAPPPQTPRSGMTGEALFEQSHCNACHVSEFTSGTVAEAALSHVTFHPYADFLLHDVVGDGIVQGAGTEQLIRTAPLWGLIERADVALLHDGRITGGTAEQNLNATILAHDHEAAFSRAAYLALSPAQQGQLLDFLLSLGRGEFDIEGNSTVDDFDWFFLWNGGHFTGPDTSGRGFFGPDDESAVADIDQDGDFDMVDFASLQRAFTGQL